VERENRGFFSGINRPLETNLQAVWDQVSDLPCFVDQALHQGGPCEGPLMVLHGDEDICESQIIPGVYWSTDKDSIEQLVSHNCTPARYFVGYAGWGSGQLESEMDSGAWLPCPATKAHIFADPQSQWSRLKRRITFSIVHPWLNPRLIPDEPNVN
jgi:putative transcriptional regulator